MAATPGSARRVLGAWIATEVLAAHTVRDGWNSFAAEKQGQRRSRATAVKDGATCWEAPRDDDATPWSSPDQPPPTADEEPLPSWYSVVIGALPAEKAFQRLDEVFDDEADEDRVRRKQKGHVVAATVILDEQGIMVPDTLALASFAWGLGRLLPRNPSAELSVWDEEERSLKQLFGDRLSPTDVQGMPRPLTWRDLRSVSAALREAFGLDPALWTPTPCAVRMVRKKPPEADILSSFFLPDLSRVRSRTDKLPLAAATYLGLRAPSAPWDPLTDRARLADLLRPALFPLGRWPGPGRHPLNLLQQAAVNAIARDLAQAGLAAVNGPPGTGKTTLLRDLVAHVMIGRAEALAEIDDPGTDRPVTDLMDFAIVVASSNNAAVENVSLELPLRGKALAEDMWHDPGIDHFARTADHVAGVPSGATDADHAWGLIAARLGNAENRRVFFEHAWWDPEWGLRRWLDIAAFPGHQNEPPSALATLDPPLRRPEAVAAWREARDGFRQARARCDRLRSKLDEACAATAELREEAKLPAAEGAVRAAAVDLESATRAAAAAAASLDDRRAREQTEAAKLKALHAVAPSFIGKLFRTAAWRAHAAEVGAQLASLREAERVRQDAEVRRRAAEGEQGRLARTRERAVRERNRLTTAAAGTKPRLDRGAAIAGSAAPGRGFWSQPEDELQRASPWNGGEFRDARDALFVAGVRLHRVFVELAAKRVKDAVRNVAQGGSPGAGPPSPEDWGWFFLLVPVVSTTFASIGRMFASLDAASVGWVLVDEAGQASPQWALGAVWRARRAVMIGDPLQIEPVVTTPERTIRRLFEQAGADPDAWAAPAQSAQTLADRASGIQARFRSSDGTGSRVTGIPLLVHRRCERPMFELANRIAYDGRMVLATSPGASSIRDVLGDSSWFDMAAAASGKWVPEEGEQIARMLAKLGAELNRPPDLYVICPFREPVRRLKAMLEGRRDALHGVSRPERKAWLKKRVGTIHTFQGKEAEAVILMLGASGNASSGARNWAGGTPNLLNVAATRARRAFYVVGSREAWQGAGVFAEAARALRVP